MRLRQQEEEERRKFEEERRKMDEERAQMEKEKEDFRKKKEIDDIETFLVPHLPLSLFFSSFHRHLLSCLLSASPSSPPHLLPSR